MFTKSKIHQIVTLLVALTLLFSAVQPFNVSAQRGDGVKRQVNAQSGKVSFIGPENGRVLLSSQALGTSARPQDPALALVTRYAPEFGVKNPTRDLSEMKSNRSEDGRVTVRYQQSYNGVPVMGGELIVNTNDNGDLYSMNGEVSTDLSLPTQPTIDSTQATEAALQAMAKWYEKSSADFFASEPELWIYDESLLRPSTRPVELVWRMEVSPVDASMPVRELVLVNAQRGSISLHFNQVDTAWGEERGINGSREAVNMSVSPTVEKVPALAGATWYVSTMGNDANSCSTVALPCLTIDGAIGKAASGDTIKVTSGTYTGLNDTVVVITKNIVLSGGWDNVYAFQNGYSTIDGQNTRRGIYLNGNITADLDHFIVKNGSSGDGGGVYNNSGNLAITTSFIQNNFASYYGGGIYNRGNLEMNNIVISNNSTSSYGGGGIFHSSGSLTLNNSTITGNLVPSNSPGGGIFHYSGTLTLNNSTVSNNSAKNGGGLFNFIYGNILLKNSIIAGNISIDSSGDCYGVLTSDGNNIIGNTAGCTINAVGNDQFNVDPFLGTFLPVQGYYPLLLGSPAIDAGNPAICLSIDQRGLARDEHCDIGAYEYTVPGSVERLEIVSGDGQRAKPLLAFSKPLKVVVLDSLGSPIPNINVTFTAPASGASGTFADTGINSTTVLTDASGIATTSDFTANDKLGAYIISASVNGLDSVGFDLENISWFVSPTGDDSNSCSMPDFPCLTINAAIDKAANGGTVFVAVGTYVGSDLQVVLINKSVIISGGWDPTFTFQTGISTVDGQNARRGIVVNGNDIIVSLDRFIIKNGYSYGVGGGIYSSANLLVTNSSIQNNYAKSYGGGMYVFGSSTLKNVTVSGNSVSDFGGGVYVATNSTVTLNNATISDNAAESGGGIYNAGVSVSMGNSILGNNIASRGRDCYGTMKSNGSNIISYGCVISALTGDQINVNPMLGTFLPMQGYHPLLPTSPAINSGNPATCLSTDQRGASRVGICDIGAYEYTTPGSATSISAVSGSGQRITPLQTLAKPLKVVVLDGLGSPIPNINVTFTAPASGASGTFADTGINSATVITDTSGVATTTDFIANDKLGAYSISAFVSGLDSVAFDLENVGWFVSPTGNDLNSCSGPDFPCLTLSGAIGKAVEGDTIFVEAAIYTDTDADVLLLNKSVSLSGGWNSFFTSQSSYSIIDGQNVRRGIVVNNSSITASVDRFIVKNGFSNDDGGGIYNDSGNLSFTNGSLYNNSVSASESNGGGVANFSGILTLKNTTISNNTAYAGGGLHNSHGSVTLNNVTISNNFSSIGGGIYNDYGSISLRNSILGKNTAINSGADCYRAVTSLGNNIISSISDCTVSAKSGDQYNVDPLLGTFLPMQGYQPLILGSPAINAGDPSTCLPTDQRGFERIDICDIGAYEYSAPGSASSLLILDGSGQRTPPLFAFNKPLRVVVLDDQGNPVPNINVSFTTPDDGASAHFTDTGTNAISALTDGGGIVTTPILIANGQFGAYVVTASIDSILSVGFALENIAWYVAPLGSDSYSCSQPVSPCLTINSAIGKAVNGDMIFVATGTYKSLGTEVVLVNKSITLSGGWNSTFTSQNGFSTIDGQNTRRGVYVNIGEIASMDHFNIKNGRLNSNSGGGIYNNGSLIITNSSINNNSSPGYYAGGIYNSQNSDLILNNSTISNNSATSGGGIDNLGSLILNNSTVSNNFATSFGGGISNYDGSLILNNVTISGNVASFLGGGIYGGNTSMHNSILAGNTANYGLDCDSGVIESNGYNIIGIDSSSYCNFITTTGDQAGTDDHPINPRLTPLQDNGGLTFTHALMAGSPAIDAGDPATCLATDQRGVARPIGKKCDIGAYEGSVPWTTAQPISSTYTANKTSSLPGTFLCNQTQPNCTNGSNPHADLAHKYMMGTYNFYAANFLRDSLDNNGMMMVSTVHYCDSYSGCPYANAFWNGVQMVYGDAYGYPLADDVVAHELTHGVTQYESNLFYYYQSGAINESFSDLWGEYYDQTNGQGNDAAGVKWIIGEDISGYPIPSGFSVPALRSMSDPPALKDPDRMSSPNYYEGSADNGGVHWNSGVNNKAVYLMVEGGTFNTKTVTSLGWEKTGAIYYEAQTNLLVSGSDYSDLYYALQQACTNLIGQHGITAGNCAEVKDAVDAVEMNGQPAVNFNTDAPLCNNGLSPQALLSDGFENGSSNWIFSNNDLTVRWQIDSLYYGPYAHSGLHSLYAADYPGTVTDANAKLKSVTLPANAYLWFAHAYEFEVGTLSGGSTIYNFDGGVLEYSKNNGSTWVDAVSLIEYNGYKGNIYSGFGNPLANRSAFVGASHGYISTRLNLASLAGQTVLFRWRMGLDNGVDAGGWWVDDVKVYTCVPIVSHARDFSTPFVPPSDSAVGMLRVLPNAPQQAQSAVVDATPTPESEQTVPTSTLQPLFVQAEIPTATPEPVMAVDVVDTTSPETMFLVTPGSASRQKSAFFAYESTEAGRFVCSLDGSAYFACDSSIRLTGLSEGMHLFEVRAVDEVGNYDPTPAIYTWVVERTANVQRYKIPR